MGTIEFTSLAKSGSALRMLSELGHVHRIEPCAEFPGKWLVYSPDEDAFDSLEQAMAFVADLSPNRDKSIYWQASDDDPRIGQLWFTGFYRHSKWNGKTWRWED